MDRGGDIDSELCRLGVVAEIGFEVELDGMDRNRVLESEFGAIEARIFDWLVDMDVPCITH